MSEQDDRTRRLLVYLAAGLAAGGVPAHEVEEDVRAVASRLGHPAVQVNAAPTSVALSLGHGTPSTVESVEGTLRLDQLAEVNRIRLGLLEGTLPAQDGLQALAVLRSRPHRYSTPGLFVGHLATSAGIATLLHPTWAAVVFAVVLSPVVVVLMMLASRFRTVATLLPLLAALVVGAAAFAAAKAGWVDGPLRTLLPPLAALLPGALLVTGLSELAAGAMVSGASRLAYGSAQLVLFAVGVAGAAVVLDVPAHLFSTLRGDELGWWAAPLGVLAIAVGIAVMEGVQSSLIGWILLVLALTYALQATGAAITGAPWAGGFVGAMAASAGASLVEFVRPQLSRVVVFLPSFWLLVPGSLGLLSLARLEVDPSDGFSAVMQSTALIVAIAIGVLVGTSLARAVRSSAQRIGRRALVRGPG